MKIEHYGKLGEQTTICYQNNYNNISTINFSYYYSNNDIFYNTIETTVAKFTLKPNQDANKKKK